MNGGARDLPHAAGIDDARRSGEVVAPLLVALAHHPASVLDVGCGTGGWLAALAAAGVDEVVGVDAGYVRDSLLIPDRAFVEADISRPLDLGRRFDLVLSVEVAEHLPASSADTIVDTLVRHGDLVVFSAATAGTSGPGHVNVQWPSYWCERFAARGYVAADPLRPLVWNDARVAWWYRQNLVVFATPDRLAEIGLSPEPVLDLVHPENLTAVLTGAETSPPIKVGGRLALRAVLQSVSRRLRRG